MMKWAHVRLSTTVLFFIFSLTRLTANSYAETSRIPRKPCEKCHVKQAKQFESSRHAQSWSNEIFQKAYRVARLAWWCKDCHKPPHESNPQDQQGLTCQNCHEVEGVILSSNPNADHKKAPHPLAYDASLKSAEFCARCHQFNLPKSHPMYSEVPVQTTFQEWQNSAVSQSCQDCHMAEYGHRFPGGHDLEFLKKSISIDIQDANGQSTVTLKLEGVGHAVPTGDVVRRLEWQVCANAECSQISFRKNFVIIHKGPSWKVVKDLRLFPNQAQSFSYPSTLFPQRLIYHYEDSHLGKGKVNLVYSR